MIAVDINVLLRYLLRDDEAQAEASRPVFERDERILITEVVLAESVWTLIGRRYRLTRADVVAVVERLLQEPNVGFEDDEMIWSALRAYRQTATGFTDALIMHKVLKTASIDDELTAVTPSTPPLCNCPKPLSRSAGQAANKHLRSSSK